MKFWGSRAKWITGTCSVPGHVRAVWVASLTKQRSQGRLPLDHYLLGYPGFILSFLFRLCGRRCHSSESRQLSSGCRDLLSWPCWTKVFDPQGLPAPGHAVATPSERKGLIKSLENPHKYWLQGTLQTKRHSFCSWQGKHQPYRAKKIAMRRGDSLLLPAAVFLHLLDVI